jgi:hypothetical protein
MIDSRIFVDIDNIIIYSEKIERYQYLGIKVCRYFTSEILSYELTSMRSIKVN